MQDLVINLTGRLGRHKKRVRFRYRRPSHWLACGLLVAVVATALGGSLVLVAQLDPFSLRLGVLGMSGFAVLSGDKEWPAEDLDFQVPEEFPF